MTNRNGNFEQCALLFTNETFFWVAFQARASKTFAITTSGLLTFTDIALLYAAIWYERFGSDNKRTLVNRLFTSLCWTCMACVAVSLLDIVRYSAGPPPQIICKLQLFLRTIFKAMIVLFYDAITVSRYIFIFWLKNPTAVEDSFWNLFINIRIVIGCPIYATVYSLMPGRQVIYFTLLDMHGLCSC